jgi:ATP-dependent Clp protease ATP-binding subunit ClpB
MYAASWWPWEVEEKPRRTFNLSLVLELEQILSSRVVEQPYAVKAVADMMIAYQAGIHDGERPIGTFLFIGTTGVGKTELAKALAKEITSDVNQFVRLNMSEFSVEKTGLIRLIGAPWSFKENERGGELSNAILANPYSVVLLDEFEKAHSEVRLLFLHIFDEGYFTTSKGERVDCRNCIFIATTNVGSSFIREGWDLGLTYDHIMSLIEPELISALTPELYGRMQPILFKNITNFALIQIIHTKLNEIVDLLKKKRDLEINFDDSVVEYVFSQCLEHDLNGGARSVFKIIKRDVISAIARALVENPYKGGDRLLAVHDGSAIRISQYL